FGYQRHEVIGQPVEILVPEGARASHAQQRVGYHLEPRKRAMAAGLDLHGRRKDGSEFPVEISLSPIVNSPEKLVSAAIRDISERKRIEKLLRETHKLQAVGQLTAGLAHDFNNLLGVVVGNLDQMAELIPLAHNDKLMRYHQTALQASLKGAELTRTLLAVAQSQPMKMELLDLNALVVQMLPQLREATGSTVELSTELSQQPLPVRADANALKDTLLQLAGNAAEAMQDQPGERRLFLRTRQISQAEILAAGDYAVLVVQDTGPGMSEQVRQRALDPFFTTKQRGTSSGTGLGLAMVKGTLEQLEGAVKIDSAPGQGTTVQLYLPLQAPSPATSREGS
ncbi:MAG: two-component system sensor histidine kinase NtrB, partial [Hylemonella sp.]